MPDLSESGVLHENSDGTKVFTHGHRFPDNVQKVVQEYDSQGGLRRVSVEWTGFAGKILEASALVDGEGNVLQEQGYRAPEVTTPLREFIKPLPQPTQVEVGRSASTSSEVEGIRAGLEKIYGRGDQS